MPTYEYRCTACQHEFELFQRMSDEPGADCPQCGTAAERLLSAGAGLLFKGSGFYITDYRSESYKKAAQADSANGESKGDKKGGADSSSKASSRTATASSKGE
ncbi:MAG TPA: zinc ribbon domain-containing protein [Longimicrobiaceae bacterium]